MGLIEFAAGVSGTTREPFVHVTWGNEKGQLTPAEAMQHGIRAIQAAIEAERDAGFIDWAMSSDGPHLELPHAAAMLAGLRDHRSQADPDPRQDA